MLHAEITEILKMFNLGYGLLLLVFFVFNFINMMYSFYLTIKHELLTLTHVSCVEIILRHIPFHIFK